MITVEKWQGMITNASPFAVPGGAFVDQVNIQCLRPGQVESRLGHAAVTGATALPGQIVSVIRWASTASDAVLLFSVTTGGGQIHSITGLT